jgi:hypothetical protein
MSGKKNLLRKPGKKTPEEIIEGAPADKEKVIIDPKRRKADKKTEKQTERVAVYFTKDEIKKLKKYCFENDLKMAAFLRDKGLSAIKH